MQLRSTMVVGARLDRQGSIKQAALSTQLRTVLTDDVKAEASLVCPYGLRTYSRLV